MRPQRFARRRNGLQVRLRARPRWRGTARQRRVRAVPARHPCRQSPHELHAVPVFFRGVRFAAQGEAVTQSAKWSLPMFNGLNGAL